VSYDAISYKKFIEIQKIFIKKTDDLYIISNIRRQIRGEKITVRKHYPNRRRAIDCPPSVWVAHFIQPPPCTIPTHRLPWQPD
jgi:hypothetical protein